MNIDSPKGSEGDGGYLSSCFSASKFASSLKLAENTLSRVVLPTVEAPLYEALDAASEEREQLRYHEGKDDYGEVELLLVVSAQ